MACSTTYLITVLATILFVDSKFPFLDKLPSNENLKRIALVLFLLYMLRKIVKYRIARGLFKKTIAENTSRVEKDREVFEKSLGDGKLVTEEREEIVKLPLEELRQKLQDGSLLCVDVLHAYQAKALEVTNQFNCVTEFIKEAEEWAAELDRVDPSQRGPLHGIPFSVKDNASVAGYSNTAGLSKNLNDPAKEDAALVAAFKSLGAIPFCKTNVPQSLLSFGCSNPVWGITTNPCNKDRTPGGSSGGEACLIGAGGSLFGIGSDIGGSVRVPASFCGISALKPTSSRFSYKGFRGSVKTIAGIKAVPGIMARETSTVVLLSKLLLDRCYLSKYDTLAVPIPWNHQLPARKLRIGYYENDGFFPTTPGVQRAVRMARDHYEKLGHELVPFSPSNIDLMTGSMITLVQADQAKSFLDALGVDDLDSSMKSFVYAAKAPHILKRMISPLINLIAPRFRPGFMAIGGNTAKKSAELWAELAKKDDYKEEFISRWRDLELDLCIGPTFACPAPLNKHIGKLHVAGVYSFPYNYMDLPAGVVTVTRENEEDQAKLAEYNHSDLLCRIIKWTTAGAQGMPIGLQVIGLPYTEELILHGMDILDSINKA